MNFKSAPEREILSFQPHLLKLTETDSHHQTWQLPPELQEKTGLNEIYIHEKWAEFNHSLKIGQSYPISIYQGKFQDYWIEAKTFQQLGPIQESQP
ncbi:hypothetical protein D7V64_09570 [Acinetobacter cumulans]|uniref:Uncharacterized protein n=1 Tax=Acinetobacter cumulans TaxID=2136182 RepID=A0A3A8GHM4_9GAMM|nr:hypothetical protein [Acinetobacter cumulans]RKG52473.1 hypothetical protein D7V64_09570 [Acinetobacter cumulans]